MKSTPDRCLGVFTSGGDAPGMNAAVRSVVRTALARGVPTYAICEGYQGMVEGGDRLRLMTWGSVGGVLQRGGTIIGSARSEDFRQREGRLAAARNLIKVGIDSLVVIGGDGSLTGASYLQEEWPSLVAELAERGDIDSETAKKRTQLTIVGLVGSIDNDMFGTDMTIGADTALHTIIEAVDAITSTAASHQRSFVIEVMGRNCGYLALMGALATASDWVLIPEYPPEPGVWEDQMCSALKAGREAGRRDNVVIVAEGAHDRTGKPITCSYVKQVLEERLGQDVRETILGHVQRGGAPSAFDRYMSTVLGHAAVDFLLSGRADGRPCIIGMRGNRITFKPLASCLDRNRELVEAVNDGDYMSAMNLRGPSFENAFEILGTLVQAVPRQGVESQRRFRIAIIHAGALSPGMNTAVRIAVRMGLDMGHTMLGVQNGFQGLIDGDVHEMNWMSVAGWASMGGSELGTTRFLPEERHLYSIARTLEQFEVDGLLMIGGWVGYEAVWTMYGARDRFPGFAIPMVCIPASIDNNLPGSELSIGADTALNCVVDAVDKIKQSAVASRRVFVVEVMGRNCGYLALMAGLATGAERVYLHEEGVTLHDLEEDVEKLKTGFREGKRLGLIIRNECANAVYDTTFTAALFEEEGGEYFEVRKAILGHLQQGGDPTPFDRIQATRLAAQGITQLVAQIEGGKSDGAFIGALSGKMQVLNIEEFPRMSDRELRRPREQWWMSLRPVAKIMAQTGPG